MIGCYNTPNLPNKIKIIDFGLITRFLDDTGSHKHQQFENRFSGNQYFASYDHLKMLTTSRKDDLISLCYVLVCLIDFDLHYQKDATEYLAILKSKENLRPEDLCITEDSRCILSFVKNVFNLKFDEEPDYAFLRFQLVK